MIEISGRTDVIAQWFSNEYIKEHKKVFDNVVVGPGEVLILIKDGKPVDTITEERVKSLGAGGLLSRIKERLSGTDTQIMMVNLLPFAVQIAFQGMTRDRTEISGVLNTSIHISKDNLSRLTNLFKRELVTDDKWGTDRGKLKEVTREDIEEIITYDTSLTIDATILSQMESSEMRDNLDQLNAKIKNAVDCMSPTWVNCGLSVDVVKADIQDNLYEEVMKDRDLRRKEQMVMDTAFGKKAHELEIQANYSILYDKKEAEKKMNQLAEQFKLEDFALDHGMQDELKLVDQGIEVERRKQIAALENAKTQADIDKVNNVSEDEIKRRAIATTDYEKNLEIDREGRRIKMQEEQKDNDLRRQIELIKLNNEQELTKAFNDGVESGKKMATDDAYKSGYNQGKAEAMERMFDNGFTKVTPQPQQQPYYDDGPRRGRRDRYDRYED